MKSSFTSASAALAVAALLGLASHAGAQTLEAYTQSVSNNASFSDEIVSFTSATPLTTSATDGYIAFSVTSGEADNNTSTGSAETAVTGAGGTPSGWSFWLQGTGSTSTIGGTSGNSGNAAYLNNAQPGAGNYFVNVTGQEIDSASANTAPGTSAGSTAGITKYLNGGNSSNFYTNNHPTLSEFAAPTASAPVTGYFAFSVNDPTISGQIDYGWVEITLSGTATASFITLDAFGYDAAGNEILAGQTVASTTAVSGQQGLMGASTPEPTSIGMFLLGAAGLAFLARRKSLMA